MRLTAVGTSSALLLASAAAAFRDSSPLLAWSSAPNAALSAAQEVLTSGVIGADSVFGSLESIGCDWDVVMVVHMDELHQTHVEKITLPYASTKADLHVPYLIRPTREALDAAVQGWADKCGAELVESYTKPESGERTFVYANVEHGKDVLLPRDLPERHLVVVTGTRDASMRKRAEKEEPFESLPSPEIIETVNTEVDAAKNKNKTKGNGTEPGHDGQNVYFTTPIVFALLISFGLFVPILYIGISGLASVQVPPRLLETSKSLSVDKTRKDQ